MTDLPTYRCTHVRDPIAVDGDVTKPAWQGVPRVWLVPTTGEPVDTSGWNAADLFGPAPVHQPAVGKGIQPTSFQACWSDTHLHLAFQGADADIWGTFTQRDDDLFDEEVVEAFLSPTGDLRRYYEFEWSPLNVAFDASVDSPDLVRSTMFVDRSWDCAGMVSAVVVDGTLHPTPPSARAATNPPTAEVPTVPVAAPAGVEPLAVLPGHPVSPVPVQPTGGWWSVEVAIPFAAFPEAGAPTPGATWRANFYRIDRRDPPEFTAWSPTLEVPPNFHVPSRFGFLVFEGT